MIEEFAYHWGVCTSAEESDRLLGVFSIYQPFSGDSEGKAREHSCARQTWGLGGQGDAEPIGRSWCTWIFYASLVQKQSLN